MTCGFSFIGLTFPQLLQAYERLDPKHMWMCAMVLPDAPVHLYFDFDASISSDPSRQQSAAQQLATRIVGHEGDVKREFVASFEQFFDHTFHRMPNWAGLHWETASYPGKFSLHAHVTTEAFVSVAHLHRFMQAYANFLADQHRLGRVEWIFHRRLGGEEGSESASLVDFAVYTPNRVFRLIGCQKLHKTALVPCPSRTEETLLSWQDLVFRGMPSLAIDVDRAALLTFEPPLADKQRSALLFAKKRPPPQVAPTPSSRDVNDVEISPAEKLMVQRMLSSSFILGPDAQISKCRAVVMERTQSGAQGLFGPASKHQRIHAPLSGTTSIISRAPLVIPGTCRRIEGECVIGSAWCPNNSSHVHEHTSVAFTITPNWITCCDFVCGVDKKRKFFPDPTRVLTSEWLTLFHATVNGIPTQSAIAVPSTTTQTETRPRPPVEYDDMEDVVVVRRSPTLQLPTTPAVQLHNVEDGTAATPTAAAVASVELQPSLESLHRIVSDESGVHASAREELEKSTKIAMVLQNGNELNHCRRRASEFDASIIGKVVAYLNRFWGKFMRLGKPWMVQELGTVEKDGVVRFAPTFQNLKDFKQIYCDFNMELPVGGGRSASQNLAALWLSHADSRKFNGISFDPQNEAVQMRDLPTDAPCDYNLWRGFSITKEMADAYAASKATPADPRGANACQQAAMPLLEHIKHAWCNDDPDQIRYVLHWFAYVLQKRVKPGTALVIKGQQGSGKGIVFQKFGAIIGKDHFLQVNSIDDVLGLYTHLIRSAIFIFMDEVTWGGNRDHADRLKKLITEPTHINNAKYQPSFTVDSFASVGIASNSEWVVPCEPRQRRFFAMEMSDKWSGSQSNELKQYYDAILAVPVEAFAWFLYNFDLSAYNPRELVSTQFERDQKIRSFSPMMSWWHNCLREGEIPDVVMGEHPAEKLALAIDDDDQSSPWGNVCIKDSVYQAFVSFCVSNRRGSAAYSVTLANEFWKLLEAWTSTPERQQAGVRITQPDMKQTLVYPRVVGGRPGRVRVVTMPSLDQSRSAFRANVVFDDRWPFALPAL